jgi:archaellum biogenesis ATPase FlaH
MKKEQTSTSRSAGKGARSTRKGSGVAAVIYEQLKSEGAARNGGAGGPMSTEGLTRLADVSEEQTEWLWDGRIPIGEVTILEGDPGTNKSSLCCDLAARLTQGTAMPCVSPRGRPRKGGAIFLIGEDSISKTVRPRLQAAGADLEKVAVLAAVAIPDDVERIEEAIREIGAKLVVVDTISDFLSCHVQSNQPVRKALEPLRELAERTRVAVVMLRHFNKKSSGRSLLRGGGSVAITGVARSQLKLYLHPTDPHMRVLVQDKSNLGPKSPSLQFEIEPADDNQFRLKWHGECQLTAADLEGSKDGRPKLEAAEMFLLKSLANGPKEAGQLLEQAKGICSKRTLDEAKKSLEVVTKRKGKGHGHKAYWALKAK